VNHGEKAVQDDIRAPLSELTAHAQDFFRQFPTPLALIGPDGRAETNARFGQLFDRACLQSEALLAVVRNPGRPWQALQIGDRRGAVANVHAQALRVQDSTMLMITDAPTPAQDAELERLRGRIAELEKTSATDHLTGAWNRAHLDRVIESELSRSIRFRQPLSLILLDIDHFKRINDTHGHQAGDAVLRELVTVVRGSIRTADVLFRWGGEEFVVLAASTGYRNAQVLAEKLRAAVAAHDFPGIGTVTISLGVAEHTGGESAAAWFSRLDAALYAAKDGGRNRAVIDPLGNSDLWTWESGLSALHLVWQEAYESGHPLIDAEHRELFDLANKLIDVSLAEDRRHEFNAALDRLIAHVRKHFADEEAILAEHAYPRLESHKAAHASLLSKAGNLQQATTTGAIPFGAIVEFLTRDVVARHLFTADRDFFPLFGKTARDAAS
jgi:diguanylate cyclase (GGDEF)-like protein/hemerythrin-like metal-binding protein